jgi:hypothetical protein
MATWKIEPTLKKAITEVQIWSLGDKTIEYSLGWRTGSFIYTTEGDTPPDIKNGSNLFFVDDAELGDWETSDGCWDDYQFSGMTPAEAKELEEFFAEGGNIFDLEEDGWYNNDTDMFLNCEPTIEKLD